MRQSWGSTAHGAAVHRSGRGLAYLVITELWERFAYYGMAANLVLYLSRSVLLPGHSADVRGLRQLRAAMETISGPLTDLGMASQIYGLYAGFVYLTPIIGGLVADRWIGRRSAVIAGAILLSAGHLAMASTDFLLFALLLVILGSGLLKGNISAQVGELYADDEEAERARGFTLFSAGINVGAVAGPLVCGALAQRYGWHVGFGVAGVMMLIALFTYLAGQRTLTGGATGERRTEGVRAITPTDEGWMVTTVLGLIIVTTIPTSIACYQSLNIGMIWIDQHVDLNVLGFHVPSPWFATAAPLSSIIGVPILLALWKRKDAKDEEHGEVRKIVVGGLIAAIANAVLGFACWLSPQAPLIVPLGYNIMLGIAFLYYWPTLMALISRAAPHRLRATLISCMFLSLFVANLVIGWLGNYYVGLGPTGFWLLQAVVGSSGALLVALLERWLARQLLVPAPL